MLQKRNNLLIVLGAGLFLLACAAPKKLPALQDLNKTTMQQMVGVPIDRVIEMNKRPDSYASSIGWKEQKYNLLNGVWIYTTPIREDCLVHWKMNSENIIIGFRPEGQNCGTGKPARSGTMQ